MLRSLAWHSVGGYNTAVSWISSGSIIDLQGCDFINLTTKPYMNHIKKLINYLIDVELIVDRTLDYWWGCWP